MNIKELRTKTKEELQAMLLEFREQLRDFRFKAAAKQLKNIRDIREVRKTIARILTLQKQTK